MASLMAEHHHYEDPADGLDLSDEVSTKKMHKKKRDGSALRKAPQAPKRFKSSYICFFVAKQPEIKEALGAKASVAEVSKRSAEMWRNLPADERAHWESVAAEDKQRYMLEKATYTGPWQVPWKRAKKDPSAPKRPMSAFLYFSQDKRRQIKMENPGMRNTEVSRKLGELWRNASEEERAPHIANERAEREKYKVAIAEWKKENEVRMEEQRKAQQEQAAQMASMYNPPSENSPSNESNQYGYPPPGYDPNMQQQYMGQQQTGQMYGYPPATGSYPAPYGYGFPPNANTHQYINGKQVMVLGPNGMPHFSYQGQGEQQANQSYEQGSGSPPQYDYVKEEEPVEEEE